MATREHLVRLTSPHISQRKYRRDVHREITFCFQGGVLSQGWCCCLIEIAAKCHAKRAKKAADLRFKRGHVSPFPRRESRRSPYSSKGASFMLISSLPSKFC